MMVVQLPLLPRDDIKVHMLNVISKKNHLQSSEEGVTLAIYTAT